MRFDIRNQSPMAMCVCLQNIHEAIELFQDIK